MKEIERLKDFIMWADRFTYNIDGKRYKKNTHEFVNSNDLAKEYSELKPSPRSDVSDEGYWQVWKKKEKGGYKAHWADKFETKELAELKMKEIGTQYNIDYFEDYEAVFVSLLGAGDKEGESEGLKVLEWLVQQKNDSDDPIILCDAGWFLNSDDDGDCEIESKQVLQIFKQEQSKHTADEKK